MAPVWWVMLIRRKELAGPHPYRVLWLAGFLFWMAALHWLRLPHSATSIGWVALAVLLGVLSAGVRGPGRVAVHRLRVPVILAAPIVWTGLELARAHLLTGITMASLGHTQYRWIELIQIERSGRGVRRELRGHVRRGVPGPDGARATTVAGRSGRWRRRSALLAAAVWLRPLPHGRRSAGATPHRRSDRADPGLDRHRVEDPIRR